MDPATVAEPASALAGIDAARAAFVGAIRSHDPAVVAALYGDDARLIAPDVEPVRGRADVAAFWRAGMASGITNVELEPDDVEIAATIAWEVGRYALWMALEGGEPVVDRGRYLLIYAPDAAGWRRAAEMFRPDPPRSEPPRGP
jgi:ketosteroid isomerase-like protein